MQYREALLYASGIAMLSAFNVILANHTSMRFIARCRLEWLCAA